MKTVLLITAVTLVTGLSSCKKSFSCSFKKTVPLAEFRSRSEVQESYCVKMKEKQAKAACDNTKAITEKQAKDLNQGYTVSTSCELK